MRFPCVLVLKNSKTKPFCTVGARSVLCKNYNVDQYSLIVGNPAKVVKSGVYLDINDCDDEYSWYVE